VYHAAANTNNQATEVSLSIKQDSLFVICAVNIWDVIRSSSINTTMIQKATVLQSSLTKSHYTALTS